MKDSDINRELNTISTLNALSAIGFIIPLMGIIMAGLAKSRAIKLNAIIDSDQKSKFGQLIKSRISVSSNMMLLSLILPLIWILIYVSQK